METSRWVYYILAVCVVFVLVVFFLYLKSLWARLVLTRTRNSSEMGRCTTTVTEPLTEEEEEEAERERNNRPLLTDALTKEQVEKLTSLADEYKKDDKDGD